MSACGACGHNNDEAANFCSACGHALHGDETAGHEDETTLAYAIPDEVRAPDPSRPASEAVGGGDGSGGAERSEYGVLEVMTGAKKGSRFALSEQTTSAGRHPESLIFLDDVTVSRRHAVVERLNNDANDYVVRDAGSLNGTYLNRERVEEAVLSHGDEVQVGKFKLLFIAPGRGPETDG